MISLWMQSGPGSYTLYAYGFRYYFTPLAGVLFTFPSRYWFTIGRQGVFSLTRWSSWIHTGFHVSRATQEPVASQQIVAYGAVTLYGRSFQIVRLKCWLVTRWFCTRQALQPHRASSMVWAMSAFARRY